VEVRRSRLSGGAPAIQIGQAAELRPYRHVKFAVEKHKIWMLDEDGKQAGSHHFEADRKDFSAPQRDSEPPASLSRAWSACLTHRRFGLGMNHDRQGVARPALTLLLR